MAAQMRLVIRVRNRPRAKTGAAEQQPERMRVSHGADGTFDGLPAWAAGAAFEKLRTRENMVSQLAAHAAAVGRPEQRTADLVEKSGKAFIFVHRSHLLRPDCCICGGNAPIHGGTAQASLSPDG